MKLSSVIQALLSFEALYLVEAAQCNADNCARAATGTRDGQQSLRLASCSSFQQCTFTPKPVTSTEYVTVTPLTALNCPTDIPITARTCDGPDRYASACSCAGVTRSTITTTTPTVTTTITVTATGDDEQPQPPTSTSSPDASGFRLVVDAGAYQGYYIKLSGEGSDAGQYASMQQVNRRDASVFHLVGSELVFGDPADPLPFEGNQLPGRAGGPVYFNREARGRAILDCAVANGGIVPNGGGFLRCASDGNNTRFFGCEGFAGSGAPNANVRYLRLGNEQPRFCAEQNLRLVFN